MSKPHQDMVRTSQDALHAIAHRLCDQPFFGLVHRSAEAATIDPPNREFEQVGWDTIVLLLASHLHIEHGNIRRKDRFTHACTPYLSDVGNFLDQMRNSSLIEVHYVARTLERRLSWDLLLLRRLLSIHPGEYLIDSWLDTPYFPREDDEHAQWI